MDGYYRPKFKSEEKELHTLELADCDLISDDEAISRPTHGRRHVCPRCGAIANILDNYPYCSDCNWDSLSDPTYKKEQ